MIAQRIVTTTVRRIVFHNSVQVSGLQMRLQTVDQFESRASRSRKTSGAASTTATARLSASRISDGTRRRGPTTAPGPAVAWSGAPGPAATVAMGGGGEMRGRGGARDHSRPACRSKDTAVAPSPRSAIVTEFGCSCASGTSLAEAATPGASGYS